MGTAPEPEPEVLASGAAAVNALVAQEKSQRALVDKLLEEAEQEEAQLASELAGATASLHLWDASVRQQQHCLVGSESHHGGVAEAPAPGPFRPSVHVERTVTVQGEQRRQRGVILAVDRHRVRVDFSSSGGPRSTWTTKPHLSVVES